MGSGANRALFFTRTRAGGHPTRMTADFSTRTCVYAVLSLSLIGCGDAASHPTPLAGTNARLLSDCAVADVSSEEGGWVTDTIELWPPNHKLHSLTVEDCVMALDACGGELTGEFLWASSDEPIDSIGDGHYAPDIAVAEDCQRVDVRSERQGPKDGRVYKLGIRVFDASGDSLDGECHVIVDHDQRGVRAVASAEAYRIEFDGSQGGPACDGMPPSDGEPPPETEEPPSDSDDPPSESEDPPSESEDPPSQSDDPPSDGDDPDRVPSSDTAPE